MAHFEHHVFGRYEPYDLGGECPTRRSTTAVDGSTAVITLDRPEELNTIVPPMLEELDAAVTSAIRDREVKVILLQGAGRSFCAGFNFADGFRYWDEDIATDGEWDAGRDLIMVTSQAIGLGAALHVAVAQPEAGDRPGARVVRRRRQRDGAVRGHRHRLGRRPHRDAVLAHVGLPSRGHVGLPARAREGEGARAHRPAVSGARGRARSASSTRRARSSELRGGDARARGALASIPASQLACMKLVVNQAYENMGLTSTQLLGSVMDSMMRNTPEARDFIDQADARGRRRGCRRARRALRRLQPGDARRQAGPAHVVRAGRARQT